MKLNLAKWIWLAADKIHLDFNLLSINTNDK